ncbi:MAG: hypothetical protein ACI9SE_003158 [Neolewinella sp.]|jgi:hypothetical protein
MAEVAGWLAGGGRHRSRGYAQTCYGCAELLAGFFTGFLELTISERHLWGMQADVGFGGLTVAGVALAIVLPNVVVQGVSAQVVVQQGVSEQAPAAPSNTGQNLDTPHIGHPHEVLAPQVTTGPFNKLNISLDLLFAVGSSTERDAQLLELQGGEHDPRRRGVTIQQAELQLNGTVDKWFTAQGVLVAFLDPDGETVLELEEAFLQTTNLPHRFQAKVGHYFTEFGRLNPLHPHAWDWQNQPVIMTRTFGAEGMRAPGARLSWLAPTHQYLEFFISAQNSNGETMASFGSSDEAYEERPVGGRLFGRTTTDARASNEMVWSGRAATTFDLDELSAFGIGASVAFGANATGDDQQTVISGADFAYQWRASPTDLSSAFVRVQGEYLYRAFETAAQVDTAGASNVGIPNATLRDHGGYVYGLVGWENGFAAGLRCEYATGSGPSYLGGGTFGRNGDAFRADRIRVSPLVQYQVSRFTRMRLQYDYDDSAHLSGTAHSVWLGFEVLLGAQPAARIGRDGMSGCSCR